MNIAGKGDGRLAPILAGLAGAALVMRIGVIPTLAVAVVVPLALRASASRRRAAEQRRIDRAMPDLIDLLRVAVGAGQTVPRAISTTAPRSPLPVRAPMVRAARRMETVEGVTDALARLGARLGDLGPPLVDALADAHRSGAPVGPALGRLADSARDGRRRAAEARARRLPVLLLLPLVCCTLPAFGLLAVVPLLAASLTGLS